jgi:RNA polymerase sigma-70 factor (ECF subfamily)
MVLYRKRQDNYSYFVATFLTPVRRIAAVNTITDQHVEDKHLVHKVLSGDNRSFGLIIKNTERLVTQIVFKLIPNPEDRKDMVQEIYLKVYKKLPDFGFQSKLSTWIAQISYNTSLDYLRKKKLVLPDAVYDADSSTDDTLDALNLQLNRVTKDDCMLRKDLAGILQTEINRLPALYKTLITLYHNEELSYAEIGQITGLPEGTVKSYLYRARKTLQQNLLLTYKKEDL